MEATKKHNDLSSLVFGDWENEVSVELDYPPSLNEKRVSKFLQSIIGTFQYVGEIYFGDSNVKREEFVQSYKEYIADQQKKQPLFVLSFH